MSALPEWFQWRGGMLTTCGLRVYAVRSAHPAGVREDDLRARPDVRALPYNARPNEGDPATLGCLTDLIREMWGDPSAYVRPVSVPGGDVWILHAMTQDGRRSERLPIVDDDGRWISGPTEWAALMAAGDAAWARNPTTSNPTTPKDNTP